MKANADASPLEIKWSRRDLPILLKDIEDRFDVNDLWYQGVRIWPYLKQYLVKHLTPPEASRWKKSIGQFNSGLTNVAQFVDFELGGKTSTYETLDLIAGTPAGPVDNLFLSKSSRTMSQTRDGRFYGFIDTLAAQVAKTQSVAKLEAFEEATVSTQPRLIPTVYFHHPLRLLVDKKCFEEKACGKWVGKSKTRDFLSGLIELYGVTSFDARILPIEHDLGRIKYLSNFYLDVLKHYKPKRLFLTHYAADLESLAICLAAKAAGVPSIELMHGLVGRYCWPNTHWTKIPPGGYEMAPDFFWVWDEVTKIDIEASNCPLENAPRVLFGGLQENFEKIETA